jgi:hypothetical protein
MTTTGWSVDSFQYLTSPPFAWKIVEIIDSYFLRLGAAILCPHPHLPFALADATHTWFSSMQVLLDAFVKFF